LSPEEEAAVFRDMGREARTVGGKYVIRLAVNAFVGRVLGTPLSGCRYEVVNDAFEALLETHSNNKGLHKVPLKAVIKSYLANKHPLVEQRQTSEDFVKKEFENTFTDLMKTKGGLGVTVDGESLVSLDDFLGYHELLSATIDKDAAFEGIVLVQHAAWKYSNCINYN
jgi:hypothetical protein